MRNQQFVACVLALCFVSGCSSCHKKPTGIDPCAETQSLADLHISWISEIANSTSDITVEQARTVLRPLSPAFKLDQSQCVGYTDSVRAVATQTLRKRGSAIIGPLKQLCKPVDDEGITDVSLLSRLAEDRLAAIEAMKILGQSTEACSAQGDSLVRYRID